MSAGQAVTWAILRSETLDMYAKLLTILKERCERKMAELGKDSEEFSPSCLLVDNSDAEIGAGKCVFCCAESMRQ